MKLDSSIPNMAPATIQKTTSPLATGNEGGTTTWAAAAAVGTTTPSGGARSSVHLSPASAALMASASDDSNDVDMQRVADIRAAIANGTLRIDPSRIADGLINTAQELLKQPT